VIGGPRAESRWYARIYEFAPASSTIAKFENFPQQEEEEQAGVGHMGAGARRDRGHSAGATHSWGSGDGRATGAANALPLCRALEAACARVARGPWRYAFAVDDVAAVLSVWFVHVADDAGFGVARPLIATVLLHVLPLVFLISIAKM
jgi:hypothetical protein